MHVIFSFLRTDNDQMELTVHIRGALLLRSDVLLFLSFWSGCSHCVLNVADTTTVDLEWRQSHITIRPINLRSAAALGFNTHTAFTQTNDGVMMHHCWALRVTAVTDREILFLPLSFAPAAMFPRQSGLRGRTPLLSLLIHSRLETWTQTQLIHHFICLWNFSCLLREKIIVAVSH